MMRPHTHYKIHIQRLMSLLLAGGLLAAVLPASSMASTSTFPAGSYPSALVYGPQDSFWFTLLSANQIAKMDGTSLFVPPAAIITYTVPTSAAQPLDLTIGPDQKLWFTEQNANQIGRFDLMGSFTEFALPNPDSSPARITLGQDGSLWFTELEGNRIGRILPETAFLEPKIIEYELPNPDSTPLGITSAVDGSLWFTERNGQRLGRLRPNGELSEYESPDLLRRPTVITVGPDHNLWFIYEIGQKIVRLNPLTHRMDSFTLPTQSSSLLDIATGPDGRLWFLGVQTVGSVAITPAGPDNLVEENLSQDVFEGEGNSRLIAGPGAEMVYITSNSQEVYTATVPGGTPGRDVQMFINHLPPRLLAAGEFSLQAEARNWSSSPAAGTQITLTLDNNLHYIDFQSPAPGASCTAEGGQVVCQLGAIPASDSIPITYTLKADRISSIPVERILELQVTNTEDDYLPANNRTSRRVTIQNSLDYFTDFTLGSDEHWSHADLGQPDNGLIYLGPFDNHRVMLTFTDLPPHDRAAACFDLYILGAWDGSALTEPVNDQNPPVFIGPDLWAYYLDDIRSLVTTFSNRNDLTQAFPSNYKEGEHPAQTEAAETGDFDDQLADQDARYHLCQTVEQIDSSFISTFYGLNLDGLSGERWALDNVSVSIFYDAVYSRIYLPLIGR